MIAASTAAEILDAARGYLWILLAAVVVWRLFPVIRARIQSEDFTVEIAGQKVSFESASKQVQRELDDLRSQVIALTERIGGAADDAGDEAVAVPEAVATQTARILWADDQPENNAFLIKSFEDRGAEIVEATSTDEALSVLASNRAGFDVVISDMGRTERGTFRPFAGVELVRGVREAGLDVPVVVYASSDAVARGGEAALEAGAAAITASPTELLTLVRIGPTTPFEASVADIVRRHINARPFPIYRSVDFVAEQGDETIGIEIKNWPRQPTREEFDRALERVRTARDRFGFDRILMITRSGIEVPAGFRLPRWVAVVTVDDLVASLTSLRATRSS